MRDLSDELASCRLLADGIGDTLDVTPVRAGLDTAAGAIDIPTQIEAILAVEAALRDLATIRRTPHRGPNTRRDQLVVMANRWRGLADNLAIDLPDFVRVFGSLPDAGADANDIDLVSVPLPDADIDRLAAAHDGPREDPRWCVPHARLPIAGTAAAHLDLAHTVAHTTGLPADVFFGTNAFEPFVLGARLDPASDIWTVTDRWTPHSDFFHDQQVVTADGLLAMTGAPAFA